jgi:DNA-directed RNA polymerase subunit RPC12/RpoP
MPIEFRCTHCTKLLRVPDGTAGKQATCPACGAKVAIPSPEFGVSVPPPAPEGGGERPGNMPPFGPGPGNAENPYQSPGPFTSDRAVMGQPPWPGYSVSYEYAASRVSGPATWLIVTGALGIPVKLLGIVGNLMSFGLGGLGPRGGPDDAFLMLSGGMGLLMNGIGLILSVVVILGALKMKNLEHYGLAMAAAIIAMIPAVSPCCLLGLPFGIWAIVVLCEAPVKAAFRR